MRGSQYPAPDSVQWSQPLLAPMTHDVGRDAFLKITPNSAADPNLTPLLKELDCLPLAITLMAKVALAGETPTELLTQWKEEKTALLDQGGGDRSNSIEVSIKLSVQINALNDIGNHLGAAQCLDYLGNTFQAQG
ncbi:hypothetical protein FRC02_007097 [Tulasnella sp. 418]|nr:hypothetical protein FRC02_007097 [Tulasnella sp. 418]